MTGRLSRGTGFGSEGGGVVGEFEADSVASFGSSGGRQQQQQAVALGQQAKDGSRRWASKWPLTLPVPTCPPASFLLPRPRHPSPPWTLNFRTSLFNETQLPTLVENPEEVQQQQVESWLEAEASPRGSRPIHS